MESIWTACPHILQIVRAQSGSRGGCLHVRIAVERLISLPLVLLREQNRKPLR